MESKRDGAEAVRKQVSAASIKVVGLEVAAIQELLHHHIYTLPLQMFTVGAEKQEMEVTVKCLYVLALLLLVCNGGTDGAGECGRVPVRRMALQMAPCASAAQDARLPVSAGCCAAVKKMGRNPSCLCAVMLSDTAKSVGVKPDVAMTIPKRCNLADRPVGYKCGGWLYIAVTTVKSGNRVLLLGDDAVACCARSIMILNK
ncbi:Protease inhibitor/seed storage/LTP family [Musa troglodytarum]|uniref:Protease inhibitor/seed storage/LTP family n=1 Tax=Musa troglodytarum TaxID=320322 RepID=A0A9E7I806_9LILI|nr:Protease inhibitor/seed storage/LTP family [Musa troglodytarum]